MILHAGLMALVHGAAWRGVLITGPSGSGKSDLGLRMMDHGFALVADDQTQLWTSGGRLYGRAPDPLAGKIESRGRGVIDTPYHPYVSVALVVDLDPGAAIERMPEPAAKDLMGHAIPLMRQNAFEASAPAKIRRWLMALG